MQPVHVPVSRGRLRRMAGVPVLSVMLLAAACGGTQSDDKAGSAAPAAPATDESIDTGGSPSDVPDPVPGADASAPADTSAAPGAAPVAAGNTGSSGSRSGAAKSPAAKTSSGAAPAGGVAPSGGGGSPTQAASGGPAAPAVPVPGGKKLEATDVGVTPSSIKIGMIGAITGAMPGQFLPSIEAAQAYFNMVNEQGGINGRKLEVSVQDDGLDGTKNLAAAKRLIEDEKVFAIAQVVSPAEDAGARYIEEKGVPTMVNGALGVGSATLKNLYPVLGSQTASTWTSVYTEWGKQFGNRCGVIDLSIAISQSSGTGQENSCKQAGMEVPYHATVQVVQPDYTAEITRMRAADLSFVVSIMEANSNVRMMQAMRRQNYIPNPVLFTGYDQVLVDTVADVMEKSVTSTVGAAAIEPDWIARLPEIGLFDKTVKRYYPDSRKTAWSVYGWQSGMLFTDAAKAVGPDLTRDRLRQQLDSYSGYDFHGTHFPINMKLGQRTQFNLCTPLLTLKGGQWATVKGMDFCGKQIKY